MEGGVRERAEGTGRRGSYGLATVGIPPDGGLPLNSDASLIFREEEGEDQFDALRGQVLIQEARSCHGCE